MLKNLRFLSRQSNLLGKVFSSNRFFLRHLAIFFRDVSIAINVLLRVCLICIRDPALAIDLLSSFLESTKEPLGECADHVTHRLHIWHPTLYGDNGRTTCNFLCIIVSILYAQGQTLSREATCQGGLLSREGFAWLVPAAVVSESQIPVTSYNPLASCASEHEGL